MATLAGTWEGVGKGEYPTIETFSYTEQIALVPLPGKPILAYTQRTRAVSDGRPLHAEAGFYRFGESGVELVIAQPTGIAETHRGTVDGNRISFDLTGLVLTPTAVEVKEVRRVLEVEGEVLSYRLDMAAVGRPLTLHLQARLQRTARPEGQPPSTW